MFYVVTAERRVFGPFDTQEAARKWADEPHDCAANECECVVRFIESPQ